MESICDDPQIILENIKVMKNSIMYEAHACVQCMSYVGVGSEAVQSRLQGC